jgi:hypothetical protein
LQVVIAIITSASFEFSNQYPSLSILTYYYN